MISHSTQDKWIATRIAEDLATAGADAFLDAKDIKTGESIDGAIQKHLRECDEMLMLLSPAALASSWVLIEIGGAKVLGMPLIPILLHVGANDLPQPLSGGLARDLNEVDLYIQEVRERITGDKELASRPSGARNAPKAGARTRSKGNLGPSRNSSMTGDELDRATDEAQAKADAEGRPTFKEGDVVRIPDQPQASFMTPWGLTVNWIDEMTPHSGKAATVTVAHSDRTVKLDVDESKWWAMDWLEPVNSRDS